MNVLGFASHINRQFGRRVNHAWLYFLPFVFALRDWRKPAIGEFSYPSVFRKRAGDLTANIVGSFSYAVVEARFSLNGGPEQKLGWQVPRVPRPLFVIELPVEQLQAGKNVVVLKTRSWTGAKSQSEFEFSYDDADVTLPISIDWTDDELDAQDGVWERLVNPAGCSVAVKPGHERYDRILMASGAFSVEREITAEFIFHGPKDVLKPYGFGLLPLWGGRPGPDPAGPRSGWNFAIAWYYSIYSAVGMEFSYRRGTQAPDWVATYRNWDLKAGDACKVRVITTQQVQANDQAPGILQKMKWWRAGEPEPEQWMSLSDDSGCRLPEGEFAVALVAHNCSVQFGALRISRPE